MYKFLILILICAAPMTTSAHEFWLEPKTFTPKLSSSLHVEVRVGENLEGRRFPFDPRAYERALWIGPQGGLDIGRQRVSENLKSLSAIGEGLHRLLVSSFPQTHTYNTKDDLRHFLKTIGQESLLETTPVKNLPDGKIREKYKRSSKLLVHFGSETGADGRIGTGREWVMEETGFLLFDLYGTATSHPVLALCRADDGEYELFKQIYYTDDRGKLVPELPANSHCLLNAVFVGFNEQKSALTSDWVSLFFRTASN